MNNATHHTRGQRIAVVGGGVAGIVAAYFLQQHHDVTLFEQNDYLGGHTHTIEITDGPDAGAAVDTGFIVLNDATYPLFQKFLAHLGVETRVSDMSFGFQCRKTGLVYAGTDLNGLFAQRRNLVNPKFLSFILEIAPDLGPDRLGGGQDLGNRSQIINSFGIHLRTVSVFQLPVRPLKNYFSILYHQYICSGSSLDFDGSIDDRVDLIQGFAV